MHNYTIEQDEQITILTPKKHKNTLIWIHGLNMKKDYHLEAVIEALGENSLTTRIVSPQAPIRAVTVMKTSASSWFDIKFRGEKSFTCDFNEAFSSEQVHDSFLNVLQPIIIKEKGILKETGGKLIVSGFSQGCGMSLHCLYSASNMVDAVIGIAGYFLGPTKFKHIEQPVYIIHGLNDDLRPWEQCKNTYKGKIEEKNILLVEKMAHEISPATREAMKIVYEKIFYFWKSPKL